MLYLIIYTILWAIVFFIYQRKRGIIDSGSVIVFSYFIFSVFSILLLKDENYKKEFFDLSFLPFLYLFIMLLLAIWPIISFNGKQIKKLQVPRYPFLRNICILCVAPSLLTFFDSITHITDGVILLFLTTEGAQEMYETALANADNAGHGGLNNIFVVLSGTFSYIGLFLFFYLLALNNYSKYKFMLWGLGISILLNFLNLIASGSRNGTLNFGLAILITYFGFRVFFCGTIKKFTNFLGAVVVALIVFPIAIMTTSRFGDNDKSSSSALFYAGHSTLYFNKYAFDNNGIRYGDRTIPLFKKIVGFSNVPSNFIERRNKYKHLKINDEFFTTFVGDFVLDFGPLMAVVIFIFFSVYFNSKTRIKKGSLLFRQFLLLHLLMLVCIQGGMYLFSFADTGNLNIMAYILVYFYSSSLDKKQYIKLKTINIFCNSKVSVQKCSEGI